MPQTIKYKDGAGDEQTIPLAELESKVEDGTIEDETLVLGPGMDDYCTFADSVEYLMSLMPPESFIFADGEEQIDATAGQLPELLAAGTIDDETLIYFEGLSEWTAFVEVKERMGVGEVQAADESAPEPEAEPEADEDEAEPEAEPEPEAGEDEAEPAEDESVDISEGLPPAKAEGGAAAKAAEEAAAALEAAKKAAEEVDVESPVFKGKLKAMVDGGLPEEHSSRCLVAVGGDLDKATELLQGVMDSIGGGGGAVASMPEEELYAKVDEIMEEIDTFKAGAISFRQFLSWVKRQSGVKRLDDETNARAQALFNEFDHDDSCSLDRDKMKNVISECSNGRLGL